MLLGHDLMREEKTRFPPVASPKMQSFRNYCQSLAPTCNANPPDLAFSYLKRETQVASCFNQECVQKKRLAWRNTLNWTLTEYFFESAFCFSLGNILDQDGV